MRNNRSLLMALSIALPACADISASVRMHPTAVRPLTPDPAAATVVFFRPGGGGANALFDETGRALGEPLTGTKLVVKVAPGPHTFIKAMYADSHAANYALFKNVGQICSSVSGTLEAGKLYFVEAGLFKLFALTPADPRLPKWTALPDAELDPSVGPNTVAADPEWPGCVEGAHRSDAERKDREKGTLALGASAWPAQ